MNESSSQTRVALVTGASRGLGRAAAARLASDGFFVVLTYRSNEAEAEGAVADIEKQGGKALHLQLDVGSLESIEAFFANFDAAVSKVLGESRIDVLVNNAGVMSDQEIGHIDASEFARVFDINVRGALFVTQHALADRLRDGGRVILLGTGLTRFSMPQYLAYSMSKGAINTMTQVLAKTLGPRGITVNTLAPGAIETDMVPYLRTAEGSAQMASVTALARHGVPDDISNVVSFLASEDSRWVTAQRIEASGGMFL
ncbi:MAG: SDR family oxidoreductase [Myxococcota bacterium]